MDSRSRFSLTALHDADVVAAGRLGIAIQYAPEGFESNRIEIIPGSAVFIGLRTYGPVESVLTGAYKMPRFELVDWEPETRTSFSTFYSLLHAWDIDSSTQPSLDINSVKTR